MYFCNDKGAMEILELIDYRFRVAFDLPFFGTDVVKVTKLNHPCDKRGIGELSIIPQTTAE